MPNCFSYIQIYALDEEELAKIIVVNLPIRSSESRVWIMGRYAHGETKGHNSTPEVPETHFFSSVDDTVNVMPKLVREDFREKA